MQFRKISLQQFGVCGIRFHQLSHLTAYKTPERKSFRRISSTYYTIIYFIHFTRTYYHNIVDIFPFILHLKHVWRADFMACRSTLDHQPFGGSPLLSLPREYFIFDSNVVNTIYRWYSLFHFTRFIPVKALEKLLLLFFSRSRIQYTLIRIVYTYVLQSHISINSLENDCKLYIPY